MTSVEHTPIAPEPSNEQQPDAFHAIDSLRADLRRTEELRALWEKFGGSPTKVPSNVSGQEMIARDFRAAEMLLRAPEFRSTPRAIELLADRLASYFANDRSLDELLAHAR